MAAVILDYFRRPCWNVATIAENFRRCYFRFNGHDADCYRELSTERWMAAAVLLREEEASLRLSEDLFCFQFADA